MRYSFTDLGLSKYHVVINPLTPIVSPGVCSASPGRPPPPNHQQQHQLSHLLSWQLQEGCQDPPQLVWMENAGLSKISELRSSNLKHSDQRNCVLSLLVREERDLPGGDQQDRLLEAQEGGERAGKQGE
jgi:hypothetical protein